MNRIFIIGNLTRDPELRSTRSGKQVCSFTVAVNRRAKAQDGQQEADFFQVSAWDRLAETCQTYLAKGRKVAVIGAVSVDTYQGRDGKTYANLNVMASDVEFLTPKSEVMQGIADAAGLPPVKVDEQSGLQEVDGDELPF